MADLIYTVSKEEAVEISACFKTTDKGAFATKYVDMGPAIEVMRKWRKKNGLGNKVDIVLKKEVKLRKQATYQKTIRTMVCPFTKLIYGKFRGINPQNSVPQWAAMELNEYRSFNLDDDGDAADWLIMRLAPYIEGSVNADKGGADNCFWEFSDQRANNSNVVNRARDFVRATELLTESSGSEMVNLARMLEMQTIPGDEKTMELVDIHGFLLQIAMNDPTAFLSKATQQNKNYLETFYAGQSIGMIQHSFTNGYSCMGNPLGHSIDDVCTCLRNDRNLYGVIRAEINRNDILAHRMEEFKPTKGKEISQKEIFASNGTANLTIDENAIY